MGERITRHDVREHDETARQADLALLVAALGGGPDSGDRLLRLTELDEAEREDSRLDDVGR